MTQIVGQPFRADVLDLRKRRGRIRTAVSSEVPAVPSLQRVIAMFDDALRELGVEATPHLLERWGVLVHESMSGRGRRYHTIDHVFDISEGAGPIETLAILFHDTVYCQADGGMRELHYEPLGNAVYHDGDGWTLTDHDESDPLRTLTLRVFGFEPGQTLSPFGGLNELLSALLACRALGDVLPRDMLVRIVACIEATIPFRPKRDGVEALERLYERLVVLDRDLQLGMGEEDLARSVGRAAIVGNRDVGNFASEDPTIFLDNTWKLLPETNESLRGKRLYTVTEYRLAIEKMIGFFEHLDPTVVFQGFRDTPSAQEMNRLDAAATRNVKLGLCYMEAKLLAALVLEAIAMRTGGDAPIALFMGDLPGPQRTARLEDFLPEAKTSAQDVNIQILTLLAEGRTRASDFDLKTSPLAAYLYATLGDAATRSSLKVASERGLDGLLDALPRKHLKGIANAAAEIATTRDERLRALF